jgi:hypothetical protein
MLQNARFKQWVGADSFTAILRIGHHPQEKQDAAADADAAAWAAVTFLLGACTSANWLCFVLFLLRERAFRHLKQTMTSALEALEIAGILQRVFTFLPGNWIFIGAVCRKWKAVYANIGDHEAHCFDV